MVSAKVLPTPSVLSTVRSPPMPRARSRLIASPSPTPGCRRVSRWSDCTNGYAAPSGSPKDGAKGAVVSSAQMAT